MAETDNRRRPENARTRMLVDSLLERVAELELDHNSTREELLELAALLGRISTAIDLEESPRGTTYLERPGAENLGLDSECLHCGAHVSKHTGDELTCPRWRPFDVELPR